MPSPWSVFIPAAAAATFGATWLLTPAPRSGAAAPLPHAGMVVATRQSMFPPGPAPAPRARPVIVHAPRSPAKLAASEAATHRAKAAVVDIYYPGCNAVRAAGAAPLYRGQPGYRPEMDGDDDGIACEPHRHDW